VITTRIGAIPFVDVRTNRFKDAFLGTTSLAEIPVSDPNDANRAMIALIDDHRELRAPSGGLDEAWRPPPRMSRVVKHSPVAQVWIGVECLLAD